MCYPCPRTPVTYVPSPYTEVRWGSSGWVSIFTTAKNFPLIEQHYTETHGYTELNFAAFAMLGLRFCPRTRGVQDQLIWRIDAAS
jgi:hypothetical protein